mmetsp:Transcript_9748/g.36177  ORF Transcript_9748/g.36177 Transcript_9748/m.36177 type:complete len:210 (+) Transcript_9748:347-976(+)
MTIGPTRKTKSPAVFGRVRASPSPPLGADAIARAFTAGPAAAVPIPHSPMQSCSSRISPASFANPRPSAHATRLTTTTAFKPTLSATTPPSDALAMPSSAVRENNSPTWPGVAPRVSEANHGMQVSFATKPSAFADAASTNTFCLLSRNSVPQSLFARRVAICSLNKTSSSSDMSTLINACSSLFSNAPLISGSKLYPAVQTSAAKEMT